MCCSSRSTKRALRSLLLRRLAGPLHLRELGALLLRLLLVVVLVRRLLRPLAREAAGCGDGGAVRGGVECVESVQLHFLAWGLCRGREAEREEGSGVYQVLQVWVAEPRQDGGQQVGHWVDPVPQQPWSRSTEAQSKTVETARPAS